MLEAWFVFWNSFLVSFCCGIVFVGIFATFPLWIFGFAATVIAVDVATKLTLWIDRKYLACKFEGDR